MRLSEEIFKKEKFPYVKGSLFNGTVGYEPSAVELFLEDIAVKVEKMENENARLREQVRALLEEQELRGSSPATPQAPQKLAKIDGADAETTNHMKEDIKKKLKQIETLERSYKRMIYIAEQEAEEIKDESRKEATRILKDAQEKAESLIREANNRFSEGEREIHVLNAKAAELKERLKNVAQFIEEAVS